jgi:hypothetical protein
LGGAKNFWRRKDEAIHLFDDKYTMLSTRHINFIVRSAAVVRVIVVVIIIIRTGGGVV